MPSAELAPAPYSEMMESSTERFPHFGIPGFEKLPQEAQDRYLKIPAEMLDKARPLIEAKIAEYSEANQDANSAQAEKAAGKTEEMTATNRETQASTAIETFHRAESGDPDAKKELMDQKKELLKEEPTDDEIFRTILETNSSNPFALDTAMEVMLSDSEAQAHQDVLDLFKEFRGDLTSVDDAIKPGQQIDLFIELTKGSGTLAERMFFVRKVLSIMTRGGTKSLFAGLHDFNVISGGEVLLTSVNRLKGIANQEMEG